MIAQRLSRWERWLKGGTSATGFAAVAVATLTALGVSPVRAADAATRVVVNVAAQPLEAALVELSRQGHVQLVIATNSLPSKTTGSLHGAMALGSAFDELLQDTGLTYRLVGEHTIAIVKVSASTSHQRSNRARVSGGAGARSR